jgi:hypothetical protein
VAKKYFNFKLPQNCGKKYKTLKIATTIEIKAGFHQHQSNFISVGIHDYFLKIVIVFTKYKFLE